MEETGTIEFVRNAVIASVCGHSRGIGGKPCFRLLSGRPWVRIPPGVPSKNRLPFRGDRFSIDTLRRREPTAAVANERSVSPVGCPRSGSDSSLLARNEHRHRSKVSVRRLSERYRIPPGVPQRQVPLHEDPAFCDIQSGI